MIALKKDCIMKLKLELSTIYLETDSYIKEKTIDSIISIVSCIHDIYIDDVYKYIVHSFSESDVGEGTLIVYLRDLVVFFNWFNKDIEELTNLDCKAYKLYLRDEYKYKNKNISIKSANTKIVSVNQYLKFLNQILNKNIGFRIKQFKIEHQNFTKDIITNDDISRMINQARKENDIRAVTIMYTLFYTGVRVSEMIKINISDIGKDSVLLMGKGDKYREILLPTKLRHQLLKYKQVRKEPLRKTNKLFVGERGPLKRQAIHKIIKKYCSKARGIKKETAHAHAFRHRFALEIAKLGANQTVIAQLLGHSINVTDIYMQEDKKTLLKLVNQLSLEE